MAVITQQDNAIVNDDIVTEHELACEELEHERYEDGIDIADPRYL